MLRSPVNSRQAATYSGEYSMAPTMTSNSAWSIVWSASEANTIFTLSSRCLYGITMLNLRSSMAASLTWNCLTNHQFFLGAHIPVHQGVQVPVQGRPGGQHTGAERRHDAAGLLDDQGSGRPVP